jgi:hypothetical protein
MVMSITKQVFAEDSDQDDIETNIHPRIIIPESYCQLDVEIDSNNDFSSEDDKPQSPFICIWGKLTTVA